MVTVGEVMTRDPVMLGAGSTLREALWTMRDRGISSVLVVPQPGSAEYGILTMRDVIAKHEVVFWAVNVLGGFVAGVFSAVLILALGDRFREASPGSTRIATEFGVFGAAAFASAAIVRQVGFASLTGVYRATSAGGAAAFYAMNGVVDALIALSGIAMGFGVLLLGSVMVKSGRYASVGTLSVVAGAAMVLGGFINNVYFYMASSVATIVWLTWTALSLRAEVGPALFNFVVKRNGRRAAKAA